MASSIRFAAAWGLVVSGVFCAWTSPLLALGGTYQIDAQGHIVAEQLDWPAGLAGLAGRAQHLNELM